MFLELGRGLYFTAQVIYVLATVLVSSLVHKALVKIKASVSLRRAHSSALGDSLRRASSRAGIGSAAIGEPRAAAAAATPAAGPSC